MKVEKAKIENRRKKMDRRENKDKTSFSLLLLGWRENEIKENEKKNFLASWREKWESKECKCIKFNPYYKWRVEQNNKDEIIILNKITLSP